MFDIILGIFFGIAFCIALSVYRTKYVVYDGSLVVSKKEDGSKLYSLELNGDPVTFEHKHAITFKVTHKNSAE